MIKNRRDCKSGWQWLAFIWSFVLLASCAPKPEQEILGKWHEVGGTEMIIFFEGGIVNIEDDGEIITGSYEFVGANELQLEISGLAELAGPVMVKGSMSEQALTFTWPDGTIYNYTRPK